VSEIMIRTAEPADAPALAELAAETFPLACPPHTTQASIAAFIAEHFTVARFDEYLADGARALLIAEAPSGSSATRCSSRVSRATRMPRPHLLVGRSSS
jgi:diamine N-acetyltransferase